MLDDLLTANAAYAENFSGGDLPREPARRLLVVTCMDARIDTLAVLGLSPGDAHVLRNAGGRVTDDVIRSLVVSSRLLGVENVAVMHHTGCGMASISRRDVREMLSEIDEEHLESFELWAIDDQKQALADDVAAVRTSPLLPPLTAHGLLYDVTTGRVEHLV
jgi:carbonic anhydrase